MKDKDNQKYSRKHEVSRQRYLLLKRFERLFETPMVVLGFVWIALLILELLHFTNPFINGLGLTIWGIFIIDFLVKLVLAPNKTAFLRSNIVTVISLVVPAFRILRAFRLIRFLRLSRGIRLVKVLGSLNRGMRALSATLRRRALIYVLCFTLMVLFVGAAGMYAFEKEVYGGLTDYSTALWWTAMILTTMGSDYWPLTAEGRILCLIIAVYAFAVFGYVTAAIASFFIGQDAQSKDGEIAGSKEIAELRKEIQERKELIRNKGN